MNIISEWKEYETELQGEKVRMELKPLTVAEFRLIYPYMRKFETVQETIDKILELVGKCTQIFRDHVRNITGITLDGAPVTAENLTQEVLVSRLAQAIIGELFTRSMLTDTDSKNSGSPSTAIEGGE